jgi:putative cell wall-binding protein
VSASLGVLEVSTVLRRLPLLALALALAAGLAAVPPAPEPAVAAPAPQRATPVAPGVTRLEYRFAKPTGAPIAAQVLTVQRRPDVRVTSVLAQGRVPGLEQIATMNQRLQPDGGVAVLNAGFWHNQPIGEPNSYFATGSRLVSESETQGDPTGTPPRGTRGTFGVTPDGLGVIDRIDARVHLRATPNPLLVTGLNRLDRVEPFFNADGADALYVYTPEFGGQVTIPNAERGDATALAVPGLVVPASGEGTRAPAPAVREVPRGTPVAIPSDGALLVAYGRTRDSLRRIPVGSTLQAVTQIGFPAGERSRPAAWSSIAEGVAAGPLLVRDGQMVDPISWQTEGFTPGHNDATAPRSAVGVRADGTMLLVAVDGRQYRRGDDDTPAITHSAGMTMAELARFLLDLGAVDALALDGGGSTQLSVDGILRNQPCERLGACGSPRHVATGIAVVHDYRYEHTTRLSGAGREATAAAAARAAFPQGSTEVVLASAGNFPDALAGGPLAARLRAPLLLAGRDVLAPATREALRALGARRVTILGGTGVIGAPVVEQLARDGYAVRRLSGSGRVETAVAIAEASAPTSERVILASAGGFADALSAAAPAGLAGAPILLTTRDRLHPATRDAIAERRPAEVVIVGGTGVIDQQVELDVRLAQPLARVTRLAGGDRYGTARAVNEWAERTVPDLDATGLVVARGDTFPDALAGGPLAAARRQLLMIVPGGDVRAAGEAAAYLDRRGAGPLRSVTLLGGFGVLSSYQQWQLDQLAR